MRLCLQKTKQNRIKSCLTPFSGAEPLWDQQCYWLMHWEMAEINLRLFHLEDVQRVTFWWQWRWFGDADESVIAIQVWFRSRSSLIRHRYYKIFLVGYWSARHSWMRLEALNSFLTNALGVPAGLLFWFSPFEAKVCMWENGSGRKQSKTEPWGRVWVDKHWNSSRVPLADWNELVELGYCFPTMLHDNILKSRSQFHQLTCWCL